MTTRVTRAAIVAALGVATLAATTPEVQAARWGMAVFGGMTASGRMYSARTDEQTGSRSWEIPAGGTAYEGSEIRIDVQEFGVGGFRVIGDFENGWGLAGSLSLTEVDVRALVRSVSSDVSEQDWDQLFLVNLQVVGTYDFIAEPRSNTPYLLVGAGLTSMGSEGESLDQSAPTLVWGGGFRIRSIEGVHIDLEARDGIAALDLGDEEVRLKNLAEPGETISFEGEDRIHVWEITASWTYMF